MKKFLCPLLICPACLPKELTLELTAHEERDKEIISGYFSCRKCKRRFPIRDGLALLLPEPEGSTSGSQWTYEEPGTVDRYLWSHYADMMGDGSASAAFAEWAACLPSGGSAFFDAGCAVGRLSFQLAQQTELAVGCDLSRNLIRAARKIAANRQLDFALPLEGKIKDPFHLAFPETWRTDNLEFVVADALCLPFARSSFDRTASLNLLDRVQRPLTHLYEMNRVTRDKDATFLFSDPFSWSPATTPEENWLGGLTEGSYAGRGIDNVRALLRGARGILHPPWQIDGERTIEWKLRSHTNHYELIRSQVLVASR